MAHTPPTQCQQALCQPAIAPKPHNPCDFNASVGVLSDTVLSGTAHNRSEMDIVPEQAAARHASKLSTNSGRKIQLHRLYERHQPAQQLLVYRIDSISFETGFIRKLHHSAKRVPLTAWRLIPSYMRFKQARDMSLHGANIRSRTFNLLICHTRFPTKSEAMNIHKRHLKTCS